VVQDVPRVDRGLDRRDRAHAGRHSPFDDLGPVGAAGVIVALFAAASLTYWYDVRRWRRRNRDEPPDFLVSLDEEIPFEERKENGNRETGRDDENGPKDGERR
jgi:hypothetical protein